MKVIRIVQNICLEGKLNRNRLLVLAVLVFATALTFSSFNVYAIGASTNEFAAPYEFPTGLAYGNGHIWMVDKDEFMVHEIDDDGTLINSFRVPITSISPRGLAWGDNCLWLSDYNSDFIYKLDAQGNQLDTILSPDSPEDIAWDGENLWVICLGNKISKLDSSGNELFSIDTPTDAYNNALDAVGLTFDGTHLWVSVNYYSTDIIVKMDTLGNEVTRFDSPGIEPRGLAWDGIKLWHVDTGTDEVYSIIVSEPPIAKFTYSPANPTVADNIVFTDTSISNDTNIIAWHWDFGDGTSSTDPSPSHLFDSLGTYSVMLEVTSQVGQTSTTTKTIVVAQTQTTTIPSAPRELEAITEDGDISLSWTPPNSTGGSTITLYKIYRGTSADNMTFYDDIDSLVPYRDSDVEGERTYHYAVSAVNDVGEGPSSATVNITTVEKASDNSFGSPLFLVLIIGIGLIVVIGSIVINSSNKEKEKSKTPEEPPEETQTQEPPEETQTQELPEEPPQEPPVEPPEG